VSAKEMSMCQCWHGKTGQTSGHREDIIASDAVNIISPVWSGEPSGSLEVPESAVVRRIVEQWGEGHGTVMIVTYCRQFDLAVTCWSRSM